jgi:GNAT superfamily N-acetyltransferase
MRIRDARPEDSLAMSRVLIESIARLCYPDHRGDSAIVESWTANKTPENLVHWLTNSANHMYVIEEEGEILCVGAFSNAGEIQLNYVAPKARFSGVSKTMLEHLEEEMRERGMRDARLTSTETAHRFYLSAGWVDVLAGGGEGEMFGLTRVYPMTKTLY